MKSDHGDLDELHIRIGASDSVSMITVATRPTPSVA